MAESHDGKGVLIFGGFTIGSLYDNEDRILELRLGSNSWNILGITLNLIEISHVVLKFLQSNLKGKTTYESFNYHMY